MNPLEKVRKAVQPFVAALTVAVVVSGVPSLAFAAPTEVTDGAAGTEAVQPPVNQDVIDLLGKVGGAASLINEVDRYMEESAKQLSVCITAPDGTVYVVSDTTEIPLFKGEQYVVTIEPQALATQLGWTIEKLVFNMESVASALTIDPVTGQTVFTATRTVVAKAGAVMDNPVWKAINPAASTQVAVSQEVVKQVEAREAAAASADSGSSGSSGGGSGGGSNRPSTTPDETPGGETDPGNPGDPIAPPTDDGDEDPSGPSDPSGGDGNEDVDDPSGPSTDDEEQPDEPDKPSNPDDGSDGDGGNDGDDQKPATPSDADREPDGSDDGSSGGSNDNDGSGGDSEIGAATPSNATRVARTKTTNEGTVDSSTTAVSARVLLASVADYSVWGPDQDTGVTVSDLKDNISVDVQRKGVSGGVGNNLKLLI